MKNFCRYCGFCIDNGYNDYYCTLKDKFLTTFKAFLYWVTKCVIFGETDARRIQTAFVHMEKGETMVIYSGHEGKDRVCCNCKHNRRRNGREVSIECRCDIDGHYITYVECFDCWCRHWSKDPWQEEGDKK